MTLQRAKKIDVKVNPSTNKTKISTYIKKIEKCVSVGVAGMNYYPTYMKKMGKPYDNTRRRLYKICHSVRKDRWSIG